MPALASASADQIIHVAAVNGWQLDFATTTEPADEGSLFSYRLDMSARKFSGGCAGNDLDLFAQRQLQEMVAAKRLPASTDTSRAGAIDRLRMIAERKGWTLEVTHNSADLTQKTLCRVVVIRGGRPVAEFLHADIGRDHAARGVIEQLQDAGYGSW